MEGTQNVSIPPALLILVIVLLVLFTLIAVPVPLRKRRSGMDHLPFASALILFLNVVVFFATDMGKKESLVLAGALGRHPFHWYALLTHQFLHGGLEHIVSNMVGFWSLGPHLEEALGRRRYLLFYLGGGIFGGLAQLAASGNPLIGASGAIFSLMGLFAVRFWRTRVRFFFIPMPAVVAMGFMALLQVWSLITERGGDGPKVALWAHLGGFAFGAGLAWLTRVKDESKREYGIEDAEKALNERRIDDALSQYRRLLLDSPNDPGLHHTVALLYPQVNQPDAAQRHFEQAISLYSRTGPPEALVRVFFDARQLFPDMVVRPAQLARIASAAEQTLQFTMAQSVLVELVEKYESAPESEMALLRLGRLLMEKLAQPARAVPLFEEYLRRYPNSPNADHARRYLNDARRAIM
ncbi:MAG: rhomboid family intramembrane serine protease [Armatimonas sp.]